MSDVHAAPAGGDSAVAPVATSTPASDGALSPRDAAIALASRRWAKDKPQDQPAEPSSAAQASAPAEAAPELTPQGADADPPEQATLGDQTEQQPDPASDLPSIEPPRSWTSDEKERFKTYPRELQAYLAEREQERDRDVRRRQNEVETERKATLAEREAAQKQRQEYEGRLPMLLQTLQQQMAGEFADVKSHADLQRMAQDDPARFIRWQAQREQVAAVHQEATEAQQRQTQELGQRWESYRTEQDKLFEDKVPDFKDPAKAKLLRESAVNVLRDHDFAEQELAQLWNGQASMSLRDHRVQLLILDAVKWRDAKAKAALATAQPKPPVQRPGTSQPRPSTADANLQALKAKADKSGNARDMGAYLAARRAAQQRRAS